MTDQSNSPTAALPATKRILVVDDDRVLRESLGRAFAKRGFDSHGASCFDEAVAAVAEHRPELAVIDLRMQGPNGLDLVRHLAEHHSDIKTVVLTGYGSIATALEAVRLGAVNYLPKPADIQEILAAFDPSASPDASEQSLPAPSLARAEWEHINRVLADCDGNISEAARRLGLHRRSLQRKLQKRPPKT